jgi:hypothetical protein
MTNLTDPRWIKIKGLLFLVLGMLAGALLFMGNPTAEAAVLLGVTVWSFCRFYYFAFYVLERYVDPGYRFSGLLPMVQYLMAKGPRKP